LSLSERKAARWVRPMPATPTTPTRSGRLPAIGRSGDRIAVLAEVAGAALLQVAQKAREVVLRLPPEYLAHAVALPVDAHQARNDAAFLSDAIPVWLELRPAGEGVEDVSIGIVLAHH